MNILLTVPVIASSRVGTVDPNDIKTISDYLGLPELDAFGHWSLTKDLVDSVNNRKLIPTAATTYSLVEKLSMTGINQATRKGFNTELRDVTANGFTVCMVGKQSGITSGFASVAGNQQELSGTASLLVYKDQVSGYATGLGFGSAPNAQLDTSDWFFAAASYSNDPNVVRNMVVESGDYSFSSTFIGTGALVNVPIANTFNSIALGTSQVNSTQTFGLDFAEFIVFDKTKTIEELKAIAFRSKQRMKQRNIII